MTDFYDLGLRPAAVQLLGSQADEWPSNYGTEIFRAQGQGGTYQFQSKLVSHWHVAELGETIRGCLEANGCLWGIGMVFLHQIRGVKASTSHSLERHASEQALAAFLNSNNLDHQRMLLSGSWWVDVGIEINSVIDSCLAWRTDSHYHITKAACNLQDVVAERITTPGSGSYARDLVSHLPAVSGCRIATAARSRGPFQVAYLQAYTTDKSLTYRHDQGHHGKFTTTIKALTGAATKYINDLYDLYNDAADTTSSLARLEVRLPLKYAALALLNLQEDLFRRSLVAIPRHTWW